MNAFKVSFVENFLADSDAESNGQKDAIQHKDDKKEGGNKGLSVAFDPSAGPPEEAPQGKVSMMESLISSGMHALYLSLDLLVNITAPCKLLVMFYHMWRVHG